MGFSGIRSTLGEFRDCDDIRSTVIRQTPGKARPGSRRRNRAEHAPRRVRPHAFQRARSHRSSNPQSRGQHRRCLHSVCAVLEQLRAEHPSLSLAVIADQAEFISQSIADVNRRS
jgi:hypothetical protein